MRIAKILLLLLFSLSTWVYAEGTEDNNANNDWNAFFDFLTHGWYSKNKQKLSLGPRPFYLVSNMDESPLKEKLMQCEKGPFYKSDFSIGHRGAALQFPEHTKESYEAAAKMGAGILECDVTFTKDRELVCRHSQCDLHTTTNILATPLASQCSEPFTAAVGDQPASAKCCTSDITLDQFKTLCGKMDAFNPAAKTVDEYLDGTASFRTDLYATCGTLMTHADSIELFKELNVKFTPELKRPNVEMPYEGEYTQAMYAQQMIDEYKNAGVKPRKVFPQSFNQDDVLYWLENAPAFGKQAVYLDDRPYSKGGFESSLADMENIKASGINIIAPPMWALLTLDSRNKIIPSDYAQFAKQAGLEIITWTLERSKPVAQDGDWYYQTVDAAMNNDGDIMDMLHVLAQDVGVKGIFSDWPATVTYYANCMDIK